MGQRWRVAFQPHIRYGFPDIRIRYIATKPALPSKYEHGSAFCWRYRSFRFGYKSLPKGPSDTENSSGM